LACASKLDELLCCKLDIDPLLISLCGVTVVVFGETESTGIEVAGEGGENFDELVAPGGLEQLFCLFLLRLVEFVEVVLMRLLGGDAEGEEGIEAVGARAKEGVWGELRGAELPIDVVDG
jgi:hypothetical protein